MIIDTVIGISFTDDKHQVAINLKVPSGILRLGIKHFTKSFNLVAPIEHFF